MRFFFKIVIATFLFSVAPSLSHSQTLRAEPIFAPPEESQLDLAQPRVVAQSVLAIEAATGRIIYSKNPDEQRAVASTQKLLTGLIIAESGNLDETIAVASTDGNIEPRNLWITQGSSYKKSVLLEAMLVKSYNDVTKCLARNHAVSQAEFAVVMNAKAAQLGMANSHFVNAHGLTEAGQYSTASDMMRLAQAVYANELLREIVRTPKINFTYQGAKTIEIKNSNDLLHIYGECIGMKTGYTTAAGRCLVTGATRGEKTVLAVVLGSTMENLWTDAEVILKWSLQN